jgi:hypothetical protein
MNLKLATSSNAVPDESQAREWLREAIAEETAARAAVVTNQQAVAGARAMAREATQAVERAQEAISSAKEQAAARLAAAAETATPPVPDRELREARIAETNATDQKEAITAAVAQLEAAAGRLEFNLVMASERTEKAAKAIIGSAAPALATRVAALMTRLKRPAKTSGLPSVVVRIRLTPKQKAFRLLHSGH